MAATTELPLGGYNLNLNSKQSRAVATNMYVESERVGEEVFYSARRADGLRLFLDTEEEFIRSDLLLSDGLIYFVGGNNLWQVDRLGNKNNLGIIGGAGRCVLETNNIPGDNQIGVLNGNGQLYVYQPSAGLNLVTDLDFYPSSFITILNERFYLARDNTNQFFASAVSDGTDYPTEAIASAESGPDDVVAPFAHKGAMWVLGVNSTERWQYVNDSSFPLRPIRSRVYERGCNAVNSIKRTGDNFCWFADDGTVRAIVNDQMIKISDLSFELEVKGDGSLRNPGYTTTEDAYAFFVDGPVHKIYYLTFPTEKVTWGYDFSTGLWHKRESLGQGKWLPAGAVAAWGEVIVADAGSGKLYYLDPATRDENGTRIDCEIITPSVSKRFDSVIPQIEFDMEWGVGLVDGQGSDPMMRIAYSKDGGNTFTNHSPVKLGGEGSFRTRLSTWSYGRVVRNQDFCLKLKVTDPVEFRLYAIYANHEEGM